LIALAAIAALAFAPQGADEGEQLELVQRLRLPEPVVAWRVVDVDGDGARDLVTVDREGRVAVRRVDAEGRFPAGAEGGLALPDPGASLLALVPRAAPGASSNGIALDAGGLDLVVLDPRGARRHRGGPEGGADGFAPTAEPISPAARNTLRFGAPRFAPLARDVNGDGAFDLVVPAGDGLDLWLAEGDGFQLAAHVPVDASHSQGARAELLTDELFEALTIPGLEAEDVNGDGRDDLVVRDGDRYAYHLQSAEGAFPLKPSVTVDLAIFRDTTPPASMAPGETLVLSDTAEMRSADLTGDGIPDHVIAQGRKIWVFPAGPDGPQFTQPSTILKSAEDVTTLALLELDDDGRPDLLVAKLVVPTIGALLVGMVTDWSVRISAVGYHNAGDGKFELVPALRAELAIKLPPLVEILQRPEDVVAILEDAEERYRSAASGDFDGDGDADIALVGSGGGRLEVWRTGAGDAAALDEPDTAWLRRLIFEDETGEFDLDRIAGLLASYGDRRTQRLTGGRPADAARTIGEGTGLSLVAALPADVDGDGRAELVLGYEGGDTLVLEVLALRD